MLFVLAIKFLAIATAGYASLRARNLLGVGAALLLLYIPLTAGLGLIPPYVKLPFFDALTTHWTIALTADVLIAFVASKLAFRKAESTRDNPARERHLERSGYGFLGSGLLGAAALLVMGIASYATQGDPL